MSCACVYSRSESVCCGSDVVASWLNIVSSADSAKGLGSRSWIACSDDGPSFYKMTLSTDVLLLCAVCSCSSLSLPRPYTQFDLIELRSDAMFWLSRRLCMARVAAVWPARTTFA